MPELGFFFKDPWGSDVHDFSQQTTELYAWAHATGAARRDGGGPVIRGARAMTTAGDVLELVRAPAALTVLGDTIAGGHAGGGAVHGPAVVAAARVGVPLQRRHGVERLRRP